MSKNKIQRIAIVDGYRTPFSKAGTSLAHIPADELGVMCVKELLSRSNIDRSTIDEVVFGNVSQPVNAANIARVIALKAGLDQQIPAYSVQRNCASGMQAITSGMGHILMQQADTVVVGGAESMSNIPFLFSPQYKQFLEELLSAKTIAQRLRILSTFKLSYLKPIIGLKEGLTDPVCGLIMGLTAENLAKEFGINRQQQDAYALESHRRAAKAVSENRFDGEIVGVPDDNNKQMVSHDNGPRQQQTLAALEKLNPYFDRRNGTVTVGNACQITDGAVSMVLMSEEKAKSEGVDVLGYIHSFAYAGLEPERMGLGPVYAMSKLFRASGYGVKDIDLFEINEAFAVQVLACVNAMDSTEFAKSHLNQSKKCGEIDMNKCNVNGGSIALGHPVGATGARIILTLCHELKKQKKQRGCASLCIGGGQGGAVIVESE